MVKIDKNAVSVDGSYAQVATEASLLLSSLREKDKTIIPTILACVYTDGGKRAIEDVLADFREDTTMILKSFEMLGGRKMEEMRVDYEELAKQIKQDCKENGFTIKIFMPPVEREMESAGRISPMVEVEGMASPMTIAFAIKALQQTVDVLKKKTEGIEEALDFIDDHANCRILEMPKEDNDD